MSTRTRAAPMLYIVVAIVVVFVLVLATTAFATVDKQVDTRSQNQAIEATAISSATVEATARAGIVATDAQTPVTFAYDPVKYSFQTQWRDGLVDAATPIRSDIAQHKRRAAEVHQLQSGVAPLLFRVDGIVDERIVVGRLMTAFA